MLFKNLAISAALLLASMTSVVSAGICHVPGGQDQGGKYQGGQDDQDQDGSLYPYKRK